MDKMILHWALIPLDTLIAFLEALNSEKLVPYILLLKWFRFFLEVILG